MFGCFRHHRDHVVDRGIDAGGGGMAARLDLFVAGVVGDAVDHRLRPRVHVLIAHVGQAGDVLQAFRRQRQREGFAEVGAPERSKLVDDAFGMGLKLPAPGVAHRARRDGGKHRRAFRHVRIAVLAHHVVAHQRVHQSRRLVRGEHVDAFFLREDVVASGENRRAQLRHERDRRLGAHPLQVGIGIGPESRNVDVVMRGVAQSGFRGSWLPIHRGFLRRRQGRAVQTATDNNPSSSRIIAESRYCGFWRARSASRMADIAAIAKRPWPPTSGNAITGRQARTQRLPCSNPNPIASRSACGGQGRSAIVP